MVRNQRKWIFIFSIVPLAIYTIIIIVPLLSSFYYSFTDWNGFNQNYNWVGFDNFAKIFGDQFFINAIKNTAIWMVAVLSFFSKGSGTESDRRGGKLLLINCR